MEYSFFYLSIAVVWIILIVVSTNYKPLRLPALIIGITSAAYSLSFDALLGGYFRLYHYISLEVSILYMVLGGLFLYPVLNILYVLFLPKKAGSVLIYTSIWIAAMLFFEYLSLYFRTVVFTGWRPVPWSIVTYIVTYIWIHYFYRYLMKRKYRLSFS